MNAAEQPQRSFGDWLRLRRRALDLTQEELARRVSCSLSTLRKLEAEERRPSKQVAELLANVLQVAAEDRPAFLRFARGDPAAAPSSSPAATQAGQQPVQPKALRHNLPMQLSRFFGREAQIAQLRDRLDANRLVTLTGSGGVGKTRLSLRVAEEALGEFADGVWFVELAALSDPALVSQSVAAALGLRDTPGRPITVVLLNDLGPKQALLVLDNCEHLIAACAELAELLLRGCPHLTILATSREGLGIAGESAYPVPSLSLPNPNQLHSIDTVAQSEAVRLFVERAVVVLAGFRLTPENLPAVVQVCQRLDGIPLAIELAAARLNILTAKQLADRLDDAFRLLSGGSRTALPRQQTLRAAIDWSYLLLSEKERLLFQRLSVFAAGFTLEAAEAVCADLRADLRVATFEASQTIMATVVGAEIVEVLASLVAKSMVIADRRLGAEPRFHLLEITRQFAREKLQAAGDSERLHRRLRDYFLTLSESNFPMRYARDWPNWARKLGDESDNLRLALEWSFGDMTDLEAGPRLILASWGAFPTYEEQLDWFKRAVALCQSRADISASLYARLLDAGRNLVARNDPQAALAMSRQAVEISRRLGPEGKETLLECLLGLGWTYMVDLHDVEQALAPFSEAEALFLELGPSRFSPEGHRAVMAWFAYIKAALADKQGQYQNAKLHARESIRLYQEIGYRWSSLRPRMSLGTACLKLGEYEQARDHFHEALALSDEYDVSHKALVLRWLGTVESRQGYLDRALEYCRDGIRLAAELPDNNIVADCLALSAGIAAKQGQPARAARLSGSAQALYAKQSRNSWEDFSLDALLPGWRDRPERGAILVAFEAGQSMDAEQAAAYALGANVGAPIA